jgi:hypothetical protein
MDKSEVIYDGEGQTCTVRLDDPANEAVCGETAEKAILRNTERSPC